MRARYVLVLLAACGQAPSLEETEVAESTVGTIQSAYTAPECPPDVDAAIKKAVAKYKLPRWFYYSVAHRESSFNPNAYRSDDGGSGLTQLTGDWYNGTRYPKNLAAPNQKHPQWYWDMRFNDLGEWINMNDVTPLEPNDWKDPWKNLERYSSGFAAPYYNLMRKKYPNEDTATSLRRVAHAWRYGVWSTYPDDPDNYFPGQWAYDAYVATYKPKVEAEDGVWNGVAAKAPYTTVVTPPPPPPCSAVTYEAEAMTRTTGGATTGGWNLWSNGSLSKTHTFTAATGSITVYAKGEVAGGVWPRMRVQIGGAEIGSANVSATSYSAYKFNFTTTTGSKSVRVIFDNDAIVSGQDRNLLIDKVVIGCP